MLAPDRFAPSLASILPSELRQAGVCGVIVDLDNTLLGYGQDELAQLEADWIATARGAGLRVVVLSNNFTDRVARIGELLGVPVVPAALKPLPWGFLRALRLLGTTPPTTLVIGHQLFTDVPGARLAGLRVILVRPLVAHDWHGTKVLRFFERLVLGRRS